MKIIFYIYNFSARSDEERNQRISFLPQQMPVLGQAGSFWQQNWKYHGSWAIG